MGRKDDRVFLQVAYNVFDGEELLLDSIRSIKPNVDFIAIVYQMARPTARARVRVPAHSVVSARSRVTIC